jgi:hypothetical protein
MGAGNASSSLYKTNPNLNTFGGSKKQGIASRVGIDAWANHEYQTSANGHGRNKLFIMNQIGGVSAGRSMFNTSYVQPRGLRKTVDIHDIGYWDGEKHVLKKSTHIPLDHSFTHGKLHIPKHKTLTVHGNMESTDHLQIDGLMIVHGNHMHKKLTISPSGIYQVYGTASNSNEPLLKTITIDDTESNTSDVNNSGTFLIDQNGSYTNNYSFVNNSSALITINSGGSFINNKNLYFNNDTNNNTSATMKLYGTFTNSYKFYNTGCIYIYNGATFNNSNYTLTNNTFIYNYTIQQGNESIRDTVLFQTDKQGDITLPPEQGFGIGFKKGERLNIVADFAVTNWQDFKYLDAINEFKNNTRVSVGASFLPEKYAVGNLSYFRRIIYRMGASYQSGYIDIKKTLLADYSITAGIGLPVGIGRSSSMVNISTQYGQMGTSVNNLVKDNYWRINIGFTFCDRWFQKFKYD